MGYDGLLSVRVTPIIQFTSMVGLKWNIFWVRPNWVKNWQFPNFIATVASSFS